MEAKVKKRTKFSSPLLCKIMPDKIKNLQGAKLLFVEIKNLGNYPRLLVSLLKI